MILKWGRRRGTEILAVIRFRGKKDYKRNKIKEKKEDKKKEMKQQLKGEFTIFKKRLKIKLSDKDEKS